MEGKLRYAATDDGRDGPEALRLLAKQGTGEWIVLKGTPKSEPNLSGELNALLDG